MRRLFVLAVLFVLIGVALAAATASAPAGAETAPCNNPAGFNGGGQSQNWSLGGDPRVFGGYVITATANEPKAGSPKLVTLRVIVSGWGPGKTFTVTAPFPGTATFAFRTAPTGASFRYQWSVDTGSATWNVCVTPADIPHMKE
jgi:hypothetical protein